MNKASLRKQFLVQRLALTTDEINHRNQHITEHFFDFLATTTLADKPGLIHIFLPIVHQNEINTWLIVRGLWARFAHIEVAVPVTNAKDHTLSHYLLTPTTPLIENRWRIPEPIPSEGQSIASDVLNIVLVPLLAFDQQGQRVGYGGGFYDRFLAECNPACLKVGLSLVDPIERIEDVEPTDIRLDACITPWRIHRFSY